jgi:hypothetical protein
MSELLAMYRGIVGIGVPLILATFGVLGKKLIRKGPGWKREDFYIGVELTIAALANGLVSSCDLLKITTGVLPQKMIGYAVASAVVTLLGFFMFLFLLSVHQDWESNDSDPRRRFVWLGIVSNMLGLGTLILSTVLIPGLG